MSETPASRLKAYTRVVTTDDGGSAFEDAELHLPEQQVADGVPSMYVGGLGPAPGVAFLDFAAFDSAPHPANGPQWVVMLRGVIEVQVSDGSSRRFDSRATGRRSSRCTTSSPARPARRSSR